MPFPDVLSQTISESGLVTPGDRVLVAVSGGPDSLSLLHALHALRDNFGLRGLNAAHLNHGLRGLDADADADFVAAFCAAHNIPYRLGRADASGIAMEQKISTQQAARLVRYQFLDETAQEVGAEKIATAHTQDDQVETILLNILRGTGLEGLRGIPLQRGSYIRPLLHVSRTDVLDYCAANSLSPRLDPSNLETDHYTRNRIRLELLPQLERDYHPAIRQSLLRLSQIAVRDTDYLHSQAEAALTDVTLTTDSSRLVLDANKLRELHSALLRHVLRAAIVQIRGTLQGVSHEHLEPLCEALSGGHRLPFGLTTPTPQCPVRVTPRRLTLLAPVSHTTIAEH